MEHKKQHNNKQKRPIPTTKIRNKLVQPASSGATIDDISIDEDTGKDFETLMNAPISEGGHFVFKSEKDWTADVSQYSEYFTLDLRTLSMAINCIPFNKYVNVDDKYFTIDQLTHMYNAAEGGKQNYEMMNSLGATAESNNAHSIQKDIEKNMENNENKQLLGKIKDLNVCKEEHRGDIGKEDSEDELDFLLSLKEPATQTAVSVPSAISTVHTDETPFQLKQATAKSEDLEKWLDALIED